MVLKTFRDIDELLLCIIEPPEALNSNELIGTAPHGYYYILRQPSCFIIKFSSSHSNRNHFTMWFWPTNLSKPARRQLENLFSRARPRRRSLLPTTRYKLQKVERVGLKITSTPINQPKMIKDAWASKVFRDQAMVRRLRSRHSRIYHDNLGHPTDLD